MASAVPDALASVYGYVAISNDGPDGLAIGGYSDDPTKLPHHGSADAVVDIKRARQVAREYHDWEIPPEEDIRAAAYARLQ